MKKALHKDFRVEIRRSMARFISIFLIVALGVAFYSGIQATSPDMRESGNAYFEATDLMDFKIQGTLGLKDADVEAIRMVDGVEEAEGAWSTDVLYVTEDEQSVIHVESISENFNQVSVEEGRLPEKSGELFLDSEFAKADGLGVGDTISFTQEEDSELLETEIFTVVGVGTCPLYVSFDRGNTTLGSGEIDAFAYVLPEDFEQDYYTQIYVHVHGAEDVISFTDAYDDLVDRVMERVEEIEEEQCQRRYEEVIAEAEEELADAREELEDGKKEAEEELSDARKKLYAAERDYEDGLREYETGLEEYEEGKTQLTDAEQELADGKEELADGKDEIADGWAQLAEAEEELAEGAASIASYQAQIDAGMATIGESQAQITEGYEALAAAILEAEEGQTQIAAAKATLEEKQQEIDDGQTQITAAKEEIAAGKIQIAEGLETIAAARETLNGQKTQVEAGLAQVAEAEASLAAQETSLSEAQAQLASYQSQKESVDASLASYQAQYDAGAAAGLSQEEMNTLASQISELTSQSASLAETISGYQQSVSAASAEITAARTSLSAQRSELETSLASIEAGLSELALQETELNTRLAQVESQETELSTQEASLVLGQAEIDAAWEELEAQEEALAAGWEEIYASQETLAAGQAELDASLATLYESQAQLDEQSAQLVEAQEEIEDATATLLSSEAKIRESERTLADGEKEVEKSRQTLAEAEEELTDARETLSDGRKELDDGWEEYEDGKKEAEEEIADGEQKVADAEEEIGNIEVPEWILSDRNDLPEYSDYGDNTLRIKSLGQVFPAIFFLVAALISLTTMTRMVEEQRVLIGTLKALGYGKGAIAYKYLMYAFLATAGGSVVGILIGEKLLPYIIIQAYGIMYQNMTTELRIDYQLSYALTASGMAIVCTLGATLFACYRALMETPASLMRPPAPKEGKRIFLERIGILWKHLNFSWKSTVRNLFRYKKRLFMTIFGIAGSMSLMLVGFGLYDSIMDIVLKQYSDLHHFDATVIFDEDATEEDVEELEAFLDDSEELLRYTRVVYSSVTSPREKGDLSVYLFVPEDLENFKQDVTLRSRTTGEEYEMPDQGAVISEKTATLLGLEAGDMITLEKDSQEYQVEVTLITENYMGHYVYMTPEVYEETFGEDPDYNSLVFTMEEEYTDEAEKLGNQILGYDAALSISYVASLAATITRMLSTLGLVIVVLIVSAGMLAFVVLYNLNNINITERKRELATLKVLGFYDGEVSQYVFRENILLTVLGVVVGSLLGTWLHSYTITTVEVDSYMFGRTIKTVSYVYSAAITCGFSLFVNGVMHFKLKKIDMVESLKSVE
ncbi:MAG: FtsX-like permease family protein [Clostridiales bacterium]|nr:FtsX-like permease family protein [Clostridiales bacterium]